MKKILKEIFLLLLPLAYIAYILYIRLFMVRMPRMLYVKMSYLSISITTIIIFFLLLRIYHLLQKEGIIKEKNLENNFLLIIKAVFSKFSMILSTLWRNFYNKCITNYLQVNRFIVRFIKILDKYLTLKSAFILLLIFEILPKIILVATFLFDIFVGQQFYYFYKVLFLLLLPLIFSLLRTLLMLFYYDNYAGMSAYLVKTSFVNDNGETDILYRFADDFEPPDYIKDLQDFLENHYFPVERIPDILVYFELIKVNYKLNWFFVIILILHLLGWSTILFFGIYV